MAQRRGVPVVGPDGRRFASVRALSRELGCTSQAIYYRAVWHDDHWRLTRYPDARNIGRRGGPMPHAPALPVVGPDGRHFASMAEAADILGCDIRGLYRHAERQGQRWRLWRYPNSRRKP